MKKIIILAVLTVICSLTDAKEIKNTFIGASEREPTSIGSRFILVGSGSCTPEEDQKFGDSCTVYRFGDALTGEMFKSIIGTNAEMSLRFHIVAILMGVGDSGTEYQEAKALISSSKSLREVDQALSKFEKVACERGAYTVVYRRYIDVIEKQLNCSKRR